MQILKIDTYSRMVEIELKKNSRPPKLELGEIDTNSPFQSVKDAVKLFGEAAFARGKTNRKLELGEIDNSSPIQSVKDAVNLFGGAAFSRGKTNRKLELGGIDNSSPIQSVKDAVNMFGEAAFSMEKTNRKLELGEIDDSSPSQSVKDATNLYGEAAFSGSKTPIKKTKYNFVEHTSVKDAVNLFEEASFSREKTNRKLELGEIENRSPIQSVKDAVNLFGEAAFSGSTTPIKNSSYNSAEHTSVKDAVNLFGEASFSREKINRKLELGEIENSSPIQSVKDAVNLFGEAAFSGSKTPNKKTKYNSAEHTSVKDGVKLFGIAAFSGSKTPIKKTKYNSAEHTSVKDAVNLCEEASFSGEKKTPIKKRKHISVRRVYAKETQLHLAQNELKKLKVQLEIAETTKSQAHAELGSAKRTLDERTNKLKVISEPKDFSTTATEEAKKQDLEGAREKYSAAIGKLNSVKQLLMSSHQKFDASLAETLTAINQAAQAEPAAKVNNNGVNELSREIITLKESISLVKCETVQTQGEEGKIHRQNRIRQKLFNENLKESAKKLEALRKRFDPEHSANSEIQLASTSSEIVTLQFQIDYAKMTDRYSLKIFTSKLEGAKESLHEVVQEECSMRILVESRKLDTESVLKKEQYQLKEMETKTESADGNMHIKLQKAKLDLEELPTGEAKVRAASEDMISSLYNMVVDGENAKHEVEEMIKQAEKMKKESESTGTILEEAENNMGIALEEAEEERSAETSALEELKWMSERADASCTSRSKPWAQISISREEFESLKRKIEKSDKLAERKVAALMAEVEAVKASENKPIQKLEAMQKEIYEMKAIAHEARKKTKMAKAARKGVEGELRRWRDREHKMQADAASRMLAESEIPLGLSPRHYLIQKPKGPPKKPELCKLEKARTSLTKNVAKTNLCCMCHKKENKVEGDSLSYLTCEITQ